jgi:uncharacterized protein YgiM (DUF1202 family)
MQSSHAAAALALALAACSHSSAFRSEEELAPKNTAVSVDQPVTAVRDTQVRAGPSVASPVIAQLPAGAQLTAAAAADSRGFRRVKTADGKAGFVEAGTLSAGQAAAAKAAEPAPGTGNGSSDSASTR